MPARILSDERVVDSSDSEVDSVEIQALKERVISKSQNANGHRASTEKVDSSNSSDRDSSTSSDHSLAPPPKRNSLSKRRQSSASDKPGDRPLKQAKINAPKRVEAIAYVPPSGFLASKITGAEFSQQTTNLFTDTNDLQVWHITAPNAIPLSKLESLDIESLLRGQTKILLNERHYVLNKADRQPPMLFLPKGTNGEYELSSPTSIRTFHIGEVDGIARKSQQKTTIDLSAPNVDQPQFFAKFEGERPPPRQQPTDLKARYVPYGAVKLEEQQDLSQEDNAPTLNDVEAPSARLSSKDTPGSSKRKSSKKSRDEHREATDDTPDLKTSKRKDRNPESIQSPAVSSPQVKSHKKKNRDND